MRYIGLDLGSRTLGVSISDLTGTIANSYTVIRHDENYEELIPKIKDIVTEKNVSEIVLGLPKNMNNTLGEKAKLSYWFKDRLEEELNVKVHLVDERLSTKQATDILILNKGKTVLQGNLKEIKETYPANRVVIETEEDITKILEKQKLKVENSHDNSYIVKIEEEKQGHELLKELIKQKININKFEIMKPTLNDIFIEKVGA